MVFSSTRLHEGNFANPGEPVVVDTGIDHVGGAVQSIYRGMCLYTEPRSAVAQ